MSLFWLECRNGHSSAFSLQSGRLAGMAMYDFFHSTEGAIGWSVMDEETGTDVRSGTLPASDLSGFPADRSAWACRERCRAIGGSLGCTRTINHSAMFGLSGLVAGAVFRR